MSHWLSYKERVSMGALKSLGIMRNVLFIKKITIADGILSLMWHNLVQ